MNAKIAHEIFDNPETGHGETIWCEAKGYLAALEGPEVKALVKVIELCFCDHGGNQNAKDALAQYREMVQK